MTAIQVAKFAPDVGAPASTRPFTSAQRVIAIIHNAFTPSSYSNRLLESARDLLAVDTTFATRERADPARAQAIAHVTARL
jgi:hypothetical protein